MSLKSKHSQSVSDPATSDKRVGSRAREKILQAASQLFLEGGVPALSVRAVSKRAGLSTIGIYSHFNGKQGLLDALYIDGFNKVHDSIAIASDGFAEIDQVLHSCEAYLNVARDNEAHYRLIFGEGDMGYEPSPQAREAAKRAFKKLVANTGYYIQSADLGMDRLQAAMEIWAIMHGYVSISHHAMADETFDWHGMALSAVKRQIGAWT